MKFTLSSDIKSDLISKAQSVYQNAYAPYSKFYVGSAVLTEAGNIYEGCNIENSCYGLTVCAERNAIFQAVIAEGKNMRLKVVLVTTNHKTTCSPCGACLQVIAEFGDNITIIYKFGNKWVESSIQSLLPISFKLFNEPVRL